MTVVAFPTAKTASSRAAKRAAASKPRNSKNGTPEERAAKAGPAVERVVIPRRSKNGTPEQRAAKMLSATVIDVTSRLTRRAAANRATKGESMTKEEFLAAYNAASPARQAIIRAKLEALAAQNGPPPDRSA